MDGGGGCYSVTGVRLLSQENGAWQGLDRPSLPNGQALDSVRQIDESQGGQGIRYILV